MTALRSLMIELGLADDVSNKLRSIDSQINGIESGLIDTQSGFDDLGRATTEYGRVAGKEIEGVEDDIDELDKQVEEHADITKKATQEAAESWGKLGAAVGAAALATEAYLRSQQDLYFAADKIAYITDLDRREVIGLAAELNNLSFSLEDAYGVMEVGARQGLRTRGELAEYARFWDAVGTASGENATELARAAVSLRSVNIEAGDLGETYDALGFVMTHTTVGVKQYLDLVGQMAKKMDAYELTIEDTAIMLAALEERGLKADKATERLESAMNEAKGDTVALYRELGITEDQVARLTEEIKGGADYIGVMGEAYTETRTPLQWVQTEVGKLAHGLGRDLNPLLEVGSVALTGTSTAMLTAASAAYLYSTVSTTSLVPSLASATASAWAFTTALLANPITWIVLGIVGLGAALYLLASNWDDISGWFMDRWEQVGSVVTGAIDWIGNAWDSTVGAIVAGVDWLGDKLQFFGLLFPVTAPIAGMHLLRDNWDSVTSAIAGGWDWLAGAAPDGAAWLTETVDAGLSSLIDLFWQYHPLGIVIRQWDEITGYLEGIDLVETGRDILLGLVGGILDIRQQAIDAVMGIGEDILNAVTAFFGISSPSKLMQEMGGHIGEGFTLGVAQSMPESIPLPGFLAGPQPAPGIYETAALASVNSPLVGEIQYTAVVEEPAVSSTLTGEVGYHSVFEPPTVEALHRQVLYSPALDEPAIEDLAGTVTYLPTVGEPIVPAISEEVTYSTTVSEPVLSPLEGSAIWYSRVTEPTIKPLAGDVQYSSVIAGPDVPALTGDLVYEPEMSEPTIGDLTGAITYLAKVVEPVIPLLTGAVTYLSEVLRPEVPALAGTIEYGATLPEQGNLDRAGEVRYTPTIAEPAIGSLTGEVRYTSVVGEPSVKDLIGSVTYQASLEEPRIPTLTGGAQYTSTLTEPAITDLAGTATYRAYLDGIEPDALQGEVTYLTKVVEPVISALTGDLTYETRVSEPTIVDRAGTVVYETEMSEPTISDLAGEAVYSSTLTEPAVEDLTGVITYLATVMEPMIPALSGIVEYRGVADVPVLEDVEPYSPPESGDLWSPYTPERDALMMAGSTATTYAPSTTINVTTGSGDAREIATTVDRRLRQTFDRHAELYFARQRRRAAL
mgnify:CR=1 FL=1